MLSSLCMLCVLQHCGPPQYDCGGNTCFTCESVDSTDLCVPFTNSTACQLTGGGQGTCGATLETFGVCQVSFKCSTLCLRTLTWPLLFERFSFTVTAELGGE